MKVLILLAIGHCCLPQEGWAAETMCPNVIKCPKGSSIAEMTGIEDRRLDMQDIGTVSYCWKKGGSGFEGGEIVGLAEWNKECKITFKGRYKGLNPIIHTYYWPNGKIRRNVEFSAKGDPDKEETFDEAGLPVSFSSPETENPATNGEFSINASREDDTHFHTEQRDIVRICATKPEVNFGKKVIEDLLREKNIKLAYVGVNSRTLTIISSPTKLDGTESVSFYYFSLNATSCDKNSTCKM